MVMSTIDKLTKGIVPKLTKGEQQWDYLFSGDAAKAFYLLGDNGIDGKTYVLGSGKTKTIREYVEIIRNIVAPNVALNFGALPYAEKQIMYLKADISDLKMDTGWIPQIEFKDGIGQIMGKQAYI